MHKYIKKKLFFQYAKKIEGFEKGKTNETYHNEYFRESNVGTDKKWYHCNSEESYFGEKGDSKAKAEMKKELEKIFFQCKVKKKLNEKKVRLSQLREEIAHFDDIEKKILEKRNEIKDLEKRLTIAEY